jgi:exonuclease VII small subunit
LKKAAATPVVPVQPVQPQVNVKAFEDNERKLKESISNLEKQVQTLETSLRQAENNNRAVRTETQK